MPVSTYDDFYDDEAFDSELDSDEEFGTRKKKRKSGRSSRVRIFLYIQSYTLLSIKT